LEITEAARGAGLSVRVLKASTIIEIDAALETLAREATKAFMVVNDPLFTSRRTRIVELAARLAVPAIYSVRDYADAGGLMSYSANYLEVYQQLGRYAGRILKGEKPADLPIVQPTTFELVINLRTAKALGLEIPPQLLARADEVIE
jgi:putative ABC transport system substrate-binding protein